MRNIIKVVAGVLVALLVTTGCDVATSSTNNAGGGGHHHKGKQASQPTSKPTSKPSPHYTVAQSNAIGSAQDYLGTQHFSRQGLIDQLSSKYGSQFPKALAIFAVNHIKVDWNQQAVGAAKDYLSTQHFSRDGLIAQLDSPYGGKFTQAQAIYGVNHVGL